MPIYEYRCANGHQYEQWESFSAPTQQTCPTCGGQAKRMLSIPSVIFKGSGFYSTDNRKGGAVPSGSPASSESATADSSPSEAAAAPSEPSTPAEPASASE